jgi:Flp pilus assembly pilin Flp
VLGGLVVTGATAFGDELNAVFDDAGTAMKAEADKDFSA